MKKPKVTGNIEVLPHEIAVPVRRQQASKWYTLAGELQSSCAFE